MISIRVSNFRGCERAEIICDPIALVAGKNAAGKSSLAQAVGAALTGETLPFGLVSKSAAGALVMTGADQATIEVSALDELDTVAGIARVSWPACQFTTENSAPHASIWAAGLDHLGQLAPKERAQILGQYLGAEPNREDLAADMHDAAIGEPQIIDAVWKLIEDQGWDGAHALRRERGQEMKGRWRQVTQHNWGSRIGVSWRPPGWSLDLDELDEPALVIAQGEARAAHEEAIGAAAVSAAQHAQMEAEAAELDARKDALRDLEQAVEHFAAGLDRAKTARDALPPSHNESGMPCPHCGAFVVLRRINVAESRLEKAEVVPVDELKSRRLARAGADGEVSRLQGELVAAERGVEIARGCMQQAAEAKNKLDMFAGEEGAPAINTEATRAAVEAADARLNAWRQAVQARDIHEKITSNEKLLGILAPEGLRAKKLLRVLDVFNRQQLAPLAAAAEWAAPIIAPEMTIQMDGRDYRLLSASEQYRVRAMLQLALARLDGSAMVVLDAADVLDGTTRSGLFAMLDWAGLPALVCMTLTRPAHVPDLAAAALGASYWVEDGICRALAHHVPMEAA